MILENAGVAREEGNTVIKKWSGRWKNEEEAERLAALGFFGFRQVKSHYINS